MTPAPSTEALIEAVRKELADPETSRVTMPAYMRSAIEQTNAAHDALDALAARLSQAEEALQLPRVQQALRATEAHGLMAVTGGVTRSEESRIARDALAASSAGEDT